MPRGIRIRNLSRVIHSRLSSLRLSQLIWGLEPVTLLILVLDRTAEKCWVLFLCNKCRRGKTSAGCSTAEHTINHLNQPHFITSQDSGFHFSFRVSVGDNDHVGKCRHGRLRETSGQTCMGKSCTVI